MARKRVIAREAVYAFRTIVIAMMTLPTTGMTAQPERTVLHNTVVSQRDPAVQITLPSSAHYVGADRFVLQDPSLGPFDDCELHAFVDSQDGRNIRRLYWVQFETYLPSHPTLHHTYDSPRRLTIAGLEFYVDTWVSSGSASPEPGSDGAHLNALLASRGYRRDDSMSVRLVHLTDATKRKELMIIYAESLAPTGYTAATLKEGGTEHAAWASIQNGLVRRAEQTITIRRPPGTRQ